LKKSLIDLPADFSAGPAEFDRFSPTAADFLADQPTIAFPS
jgi:hypothetical protein